jgi:Leucine-rich repeat (LRR) protein
MIFRKIFEEEMNEIINQIEELKQMQRFPRYYLSNYFEELKTQVDTKYALKLDDKDKYLEIINSIESFEQNAYNKWSSKSINKYDDEIKLIEDKLNNNLNNVIDYTKLIGELKLKIEKMIFLNKTILFIDKKTRFNFKSNSFLLIVNDEYISNSLIENDSNEKLITRKELCKIILKEKLKNTKMDSINVLNLEIDILNQEIIDLRFRSFKEIDPNTFNGLPNLKNIYFNGNQIKEIHPNTFNGLANLELINFSSNQIKEIHPNTFNGLANLKLINFSSNQIKEIHPNTFNGLANLERINFDSNQIKEIHPNTFNGLANLERINFDSNQIKEIHPNTFNGLANLEWIYFSANQIKKIHPNTFNGLANLKEIYFKYNLIKNKDPNTFFGLPNLSKHYF